MTRCQDESKVPRGHKPINKVKGISKAELDFLVDQCGMTHAKLIADKQLEVSRFNEVGVDKGWQIFQGKGCDTEKWKAL